MTLLLRFAVRTLLLSVLWLVPAGAVAQTPPPAPPPPSPQPPPDGDGPRPAGVGSSTALPEDEEDADAEAIGPQPEFLFPGVPQPGTAPTRRPFRGLFAGAEPLARRSYELTVSGSLFAGHSTNVSPAFETGQEMVQAGRSSMLVGGGGGADYSKSWRFASIGAYASGSRTWVKAYRDDEPWIPRWDTGVEGSLSRRFGRRARWGASGGVSYSPYVDFSNLDFTVGGVQNLPATGAGLDFVLARDPNVIASLSSSFAFAVSRRSSIEAYYDSRHQTYVSSEPLNPDRGERWVGARYRYQFARFVGVRAGYGYRSVSFDGPGDPGVDNHYLDIGLDGGYGRSYALTRRTTFAFATDSSLFVQEAIDDGGFDAGRRTQLFIGGSADLTQTIGRTWVAQAGYRRAASYETGFVEPLLSNSLLASVGGLVTRRIDFSASAWYSTGQVGLIGVGNGFTTTSAVAGFRFALTRTLAAYAQYFYYHYDFQQGVTLPIFLPAELDRQGTAVGLTAFVPLIGQRGRR